MRGLVINGLRAACRRFSTHKFEPNNGVNHLKIFIRDRIRSTGPISVAEFMSLSVRSAAGYYSQRENKVSLFRVSN